MSLVRVFVLGKALDEIKKPSKLFILKWKMLRLANLVVSLSQGYKILVS